MLKKIIAAAACLVVAHGFAADVDQRYAVKGVGLQSCAGFLEAAKSKGNSYFIAGGWLEGYMTGLNQQLPDTFDLAPWQSTGLLIKMIESNCQANKDAQFHQVVKAMVAGLAAQKISTAGRFVQVQGDNRFIFQEAVVLSVKARLQEKGVYSGALDVVEWDEPVMEAMRSFQKAEGLEETGLPDQGSLFKLFYGQ